MAAFLLAVALGAALLIAFALTGRLRFLTDEISSPGRRAAGLVLFWAVLVTCVVYPSISPGDLASVDPETLWFPSIFMGHLVLGGFLLLWWLLAWRSVPLRFLRLEGAAWSDIGYGLRVGALGWGAAITASAVVTLLLFLVSYVHSAGAAPLANPIDIPPVLLWLTQLSLWHKLTVVAVAMTVEEAFYRAFLQTRIGWIWSSVLFALSHGGYGLPNLTASVFVVSLAIGAALRRRDNLLPCIVAHGVFDAVQLLVVMPLAVRQMQTLA
jgi:membrane protease YdiL (CAAX protease family)